MDAYAGFEGKTRNKFLRIGKLLQPIKQQVQLDFGD